MRHEFNEQCFLVNVSSIISAVSTRVEPIFFSFSPSDRTKADVLSNERASSSLGFFSLATRQSNRLRLNKTIEFCLRVDVNKFDILFLALSINTRTTTTTTTTIDD